uniref:hypothetical protein n=4 Tax=Enterocloster clostridioformis TaxID=1531 RepID=UPI0025A5CBF6
DIWHLSKYPIKRPPVEGLKIMPFFILYSLDNHHLHLSFPDYPLAFFNCLKITSIVYQVSETARVLHQGLPFSFPSIRL